MSPLRCSPRSYSPVVTCSTCNAFAQLKHTVGRDVRCVVRRIERAYSAMELWLIVSIVRASYKHGGEECEALPSP